MTATYDATGQVDYLDTFDASIDAFTNLTIAAGSRVEKQLVDLSSRTGYWLVGAKSKTPQTLACEYYQLDWETGEPKNSPVKFNFLTDAMPADSPEKSSMLATSWVL